MKDENKRTSLLRNALAELESFRRKYSMLEELATVFNAIDAATREEKSEVAI